MSIPQHRKVRPHLLAIPIKLRNAIYQHVFSPSEGTSDLDILLTCRQVHEEAAVLAFAAATFTIPAMEMLNVTAITDKTSRLSADKQAAIKRLRIPLPRTEDTLELPQFLYMGIVTLLNHCDIWPTSIIAQEARTSIKLHDALCPRVREYGVLQLKRLASPMTFAHFLLDPHFEVIEFTAEFTDQHWRIRFTREDSPDARDWTIPRSASSLTPEWMQKLWFVGGGARSKLDRNIIVGHDDHPEEVTIRVSMC